MTSAYGRDVPIHSSRSAMRGSRKSAIRASVLEPHATARLRCVDHDPFDLERFVAAQAPVIDDVCDELRRGRKTSHWMWFIFPQLEALGTSAMAKRYGIASLAEARAYLAHPVLGARLQACCALLLPG